MKYTPKNICTAITSYASAYDVIQGIQENSPLIPEGDQKTGCIGEFFAYLYLLDKHPDAKLVYGGHSEKGWDIEVHLPQKNYRVQIKTVSAYSKTRVISPIHYGWNKLFIIYLNRQFFPQGFWIIDDSIISKGGILKGRKCRDPQNPATGSPSLPFGENLIRELKEAISKQGNTGD